MSTLPVLTVNSTLDFDFCIGDLVEVTTISGCAALVALVLMFGVSCWAWRSIRTGSVDRLNYVLLPMYNVILRAICLTLVLRFVCWVFISKSSLTFDFVNWVLACPFIAMLRDGVAVFLCMNSAGYDAMRRTALFMLLWGLGLGAVGWFYWLHSDAFDNDFGTYFFVVYNACGALLHLAVLAVKLVQRVAFKTHLAVRPAPILYSAFLVVILGLFLFIDVQAVVNVVVYGCMWSFLVVGYNFLWPLLAYLALRLDSKFWRRSGTSPAAWKDLGMPLLDVEELNEAVVVDFAQVTLHDVIAVGGTATVYNATYRGKPVAVKRFVCDTLVVEQAFSYIREISMLSRLRHPNVVVLHGVAIAPPFVCLVMEVTSKGSLFHVLTQQRRLRRAVRRMMAAGHHMGEDTAAALLAPVRRLYLMRDAWAGLAFLHSAPSVVHGDIKSLNMLIDDNWVLKLCDFGESRYDTHQASRGLSGATRPSLPRAVASNPAIRINSFNSRSPAPSKAWRPGSPTRAAASSTFASAPAPPPVVVSMSSQSSLTSGHRALSRVGNPIPSPRPQRRRPVAQGNFKQTPQWAAPEVFTSSKHSTASDVYACASVMYEILAFRPPYYRVDPRRVPKLVTRGVLPRLPDNTAPALAELIYRCWSADPKERPTAAEALQVLTELTPQAVAASDDLMGASGHPTAAPASHPSSHATSAASAPVGGGVGVPVAPDNGSSRRGATGGGSRRDNDRTAQVLDSVGW